MTVELLQTLSVVSYIIAVVFALIAIALFFVLDIKKAIGDITGATARKAIKDIRRQNEFSDDAARPGALNDESGRPTDKITLSGQLRPKTMKIGTPAAGEQSSTVKLSEYQGEVTTVLNAAQTTENVTTVLSEPQGNPSAGYAGETTVLSDMAAPDFRTAYSGSFKIETEIGFVGSTEVIT